MTWSRLKTLFINHKNFWELELEQYEAIFQRCKHYVDHLKMDGLEEIETFPLFRLIGWLCLDRYVCNSSIFLKFLLFFFSDKYCTNLKHLEVEGLSITDDRLNVKSFPFLKNLKSFITKKIQNKKKICKAAKGNTIFNFKF